MFSSNPSNNYSSTSNNPNPCSTMPSYTNGDNNLNNYESSNCYRPLQQLYKTVYSPPMYGNNSTSRNIACICRPAERYKTTNMAYGSFYYDKSLSTEKNRAINYDKAAFARCYDNNNTNKMGSQSTGNNRAKDSIFSSAFDPEESQYWTQPTNDACCPTDCCNNTTYITANCTNNQNTNPSNSSFSQNLVPSYSSQFPPPTNKSSNIQVRCI